jgi:L-2-hydroxyglutarate oxidase LhgO
MIVSPSFHTEVAVIGVGAVGLAIGRALAMAGKEVLLLERSSAICTETSARNSEVIHAGIYYPQNSLKAKFCVQGKQLLYEYCKERSISHKRCGKLIVATNRTQLTNDIPALHQKAIMNGVTDCQIISKEDVHVMEPNVTCEGALYSPSSGIVDSHSFFVNMLADCENAGSSLALNTKIQDAQTVREGSDGSTKICLYADDTWISCDYVINSAGLWADEVASLIHQRPKDVDDDDDDNNNITMKWHPPKHYYAKGTYFRLEGKTPFQHLIYPVPEPGGLGVHATIDWGGTGVKFGPDVEWLHPDTRPEEISYNPDPNRGDGFYDEIRKYWPALPEGKLVADYVGVRPKLTHPSVASASKFEDFRIVGPETHGVPGLVHLLGIESPGLTSSMAIAKYVKDLLKI